MGDDATPTPPITVTLRGGHLTVSEAYWRIILESAKKGRGPFFRQGVESKVGGRPGREWVKLTVTSDNHYDRVSTRVRLQRIEESVGHGVTLRVNAGNGPITRVALWWLRLNAIGVGALFFWSIHCCGGNDPGAGFWLGYVVVAVLFLIVSWMLSRWLALNGIDRVNYALKVAARWTDQGGVPEA